MANQELFQLWEAIHRDLDRARSLLPAAAAEAGGSLARFEDWLAHNELELALDELGALGEDAAVPEFWQALQSAAARMGLARQAERFGLRSVGKI